MKMLWKLRGSGVLVLRDWRSCYAFVHYDDSPVGSYDEWAIIELTLRGPSVTQMSVNNLASREAGRALWGFPKVLERLRFARIGKLVSFEKSERTVRFRVGRFSVPIALRAWTIQILNGAPVRVPVEVSGRVGFGWRGRQLIVFVENFSLGVFEPQSI